ncbi:hypothetical protein Tco_1163254 [Tanacetum coccineum]
MADSDLEEDPKEDHADYPADGGDGDDESSVDDDDDDDEDEKASEDEDDDEVEEHLASADSSAVPVVGPVPSAGDTEAFETDESTPTPPSPRSPQIVVPLSQTRLHRARKTVRPQTPREVARLLALPTSPPSPLTPLSSPLPQIPSPPLPDESRITTLLLPSTSYRTDIPEVKMLPRKRACFTTPAFGFEVGESSTAGAARQPGLDVAVTDAIAGRPMSREVGYGITDTWDEIVEAMQEITSTTLEGVNQRVTELATIVRQDTNDFYRNTFISYAVTGLIPINRGLIQAILTSLPPQPIGEATKASNLQRIPPGVQGRSHFTYFLYLIVQIRILFSARTVNPNIGDDVEFEINANFMRELRHKLFAGTDDEDAYEYVHTVLEIVDLFHFPSVTHDAIMLRKLEEICNFKQERDEALYHAWERYNDLIYQILLHDLNCQQKVHIFYTGLDISTRKILDSNGFIHLMTPTQALESIQVMADHSHDWYDESTTRERINDVLDNVDAIHESFEGEHLTKEYPLKKEDETFKHSRYTESLEETIIKFCEDTIKKQTVDDEKMRKILENTKSNIRGIKSLREDENNLKISAKFQISKQSSGSFLS